MVSDSDHSYAATILSLAAWLARHGGIEWFKANLPKLKCIAKAHLLENIDAATKLTNSFNNQPGRFREVDTGKAPYQHVGFLLDNCESYRGLRDFASLLAQIGDRDATQCSRAAATTSEGILELYDPTARAFRASTLAPVTAVARSATIPFWPDRVAQIGPAIFDVDLGPDTKRINDAAWAYLNAGGDIWWRGKIRDRSTGGSPFMMLGYAAALRGDFEIAEEQLNYFRKNITPTNISELGYAVRTQRLIDARRK